jgi:hypothetical protein
VSLLCPFPHAHYSTTFIPTLTVCSLCKWPDSIIGNIWTMSSTLGFQTLLSLASLSLASLSLASLSLASLSLASLSLASLNLTLLSLALLSLASLSLLTSTHWGSNAKCSLLLQYPVFTPLVAALPCVRPVFPCFF